MKREIPGHMINQLILFGTKQDTGYKLFFLSEIREVGMKRNE